MPSTVTNRLQGLTTSVAVKPPCVTVALSNLALAGLDPIGDRSIEEGDRVLAVGQSNLIDNGIYNASSGTWQRARDADGELDFVQGTRVLVRGGTEGGLEYELVSPNPIVIGTTPLVFMQSNYQLLASDPRRYGVVGDGITDDSAAMALAISSGESLDLGTLIIRIVTKLTFDQPNQRIYARGGGFLFDGVSTTRLADVTASGVEFHGVDFDFNAKQIYGGGIYIASDAARPKLVRCRIRRINGTHVGGVTNTPANQQSGILISPYGVDGLDIDGCTFEDLKNDNSGANGTTPTEGFGFVNGIAFFTDDLSNPDTPQVIPTSGSIRGCLFKDIITVLGNGLSSANQIAYNDADGIRFYGSVAGATRLPVIVSECTFYNCGKRAVKNSTAAGTQLRNLTIIATEDLLYPMVTAIKVDGLGQIVDGVNVYSPASAPIRVVIQSHNCQYLRVSNVTADRCDTFWDNVPTDSGWNSQGWRIRNLQCPSIGAYGFATSTNCSRYVDCRFEGLEFAAASGVHSMIAFQLFAATNRVEATVQDSRIVNGDVKIIGYGWTLRNVYHEIDDDSYTGFNSNNSMLEAGLNPSSSVTRDSVVDGYQLNIKTLPDAYLTSSRVYLWLLYGKRVRVRNFSVVTPETLATTYAHGSFGGGDDFSVVDFTYSGEGQINFGVTFTGPHRFMSIHGARRVGGSGSADTTFLNVDHGQDCEICDIFDSRANANGTVTIAGGTVSGSRTYAYIVDGVRSFATVSIVQDASNLAFVSNVTGFDARNMNTRIGLRDGITAPGTQSAIANIYVDTSDGDLKAKFGDGFVRVIGSDSA